MFHRNYVSHLCVWKRIAQLDTFALKFSFSVVRQINCYTTSNNILHFLHVHSGRIFRLLFSFSFFLFLLFLSFRIFLPPFFIFSSNRPRARGFVIMKNGPFRRMLASVEINIELFVCAFYIYVKMYVGMQ